MAFAQEIIVTIVFQILVSTSLRSSLVTFGTVLAGIVKFRRPDHRSGCPDQVSFLNSWINLLSFLLRWVYSDSLIFGLRPDVWFPLCGFIANAARNKEQYCRKYYKSFHLGCFNTFEIKQRRLWTTNRLFLIVTEIFPFSESCSYIIQHIFFRLPSKSSLAGENISSRRQVSANRSLAKSPGMLIKRSASFVPYIISWWEASKVWASTNASSWEAQHV